MRLHYFKDPRGNFGDDLNPWMWDRLLPDAFDGDGETLFVGIGTLLNHRLPAASRYVVFGSGVGYGRTPVVGPSWHVICVRGPWTAERLGLPPRSAVVDPGILAGDLMPDASASGNALSPMGTAFMPHCHSARIGQWARVCRMAGMRYIDPSDGVEPVLRAIAGSELLITEAMHGAIVAEGLGVPWMPVRTGEHVVSHKWCDWLGAVGAPYQAHALHPTYRGSRGQPFVRRLKVGVKRCLQSLGAWHSDWQRPPAPASTEAALALAAERLCSLAARAEPVTLDPHRIDRLKSELYERLARWRAAEGS